MYFSSKKRIGCDELPANNFDRESPRSYFVSSNLEKFFHVIMVDDNLVEQEKAIQQRIKHAMRDYRAKNNLTQQQMAAYLGIAHKNYSSYESRPDRWVPISLIVRFCDYSETSTQWIFRGIPSANPGPRQDFVAVGRGKTCR